LAYVGVDVDKDMVERCKAKGFTNVHLADANGYLETIEDGSLGTIFCAQVIEHLDYPYLERFLQLAYKKLCDGGTLIAETVNPHNVQAMKMFWVDPTHQHPIFPEVALIHCQSAGFESGFIYYLGGVGDPAEDRMRAYAYSVIVQKNEVGLTSRNNGQGSTAEQTESVQA
jgi:hypothetical protein